jgi:glycosyltransferase involved in cell wall biosynthesis
MYNPKVSVIIPVYNGSNYLTEAIDSALNQTYRNIEILVINDGSKDNGATEEIAKSFGNKIQYFNKENGGVATALNLGIKNMTGEYFSWLSHDDVFIPDKIERQIKYIVDHNLINEKFVLYSDYHIIDENSNITGEYQCPFIDPMKMGLALLTFYPVNGCTTLIPVDVFKTSGLFNKNLITSQDYDLWFRISKNFPFYHQKFFLLKSRHHSMQGTKTIKTMHWETENFIIESIKSISNDDLCKLTNESLIVSCLRLSINFTKQYYFRSTKFILKHLIINIRKTKIKDLINIIGLCSILAYWLAFKIFFFIFDSYIKNKKSWYNNK